MEPDRVLRFEPATYAIHLWHEMWRFFSCSVDADYAPGCLYEQVKTLYLRGSPIGR